MLRRAAAATTTTTMMILLAAAALASFLDSCQNCLRVAPFQKTPTWRNTQRNQACFIVCNENKYVDDDDDDDVHLIRPSTRATARRGSRQLVTLRVMSDASALLRMQRSVSSTASRATSGALLCFGRTNSVSDMPNR